MNYRLYWLRAVSLLCIYLLCLPLWADVSVEEKLAEIDKAAAEVQSQWNIPGMAVAIVKNDEVIFSKGYGVRQLDRPGAVDEDTVFVIASISKAFVTAALAILVDEGKLNWDDRVQQHLPEFDLHDPLAAREMTVRDLVSHRSGLGTFSGDLLWYETTYDRAEVLRRLPELKPVTSFRNRYGYQNLMYIAAGKIVERISGMSCADFVKQRILEPLGMDRTTTSVHDLDDNSATPHNESSGSLRALPHSDVGNAWGACGLNSSAADLTRWLRLQMGRGTLEDKTIFSENQWWEMWQPHIALPLSRQDALLNPARHFRGYGLGWFLYDYHGRKVVTHSGGLDGMITVVAMVPQENLALIVLTNSESPAIAILRDTILDVMMDIPERRDWNQVARDRETTKQQSIAARDKAADAARVADAPHSLPLEKFVGTYRCPLYDDVEIVEDQGQLVMKMLPAPSLVADLEHWHFNTFQIKWRPSVKYNFPRGFANFTLNGSGEPDQLVIDQPNDDFWFYELNLRRAK